MKINKSKLRSMAKKAIVNATRDRGNQFDVVTKDQPIPRHNGLVVILHHSIK